MSYLLALTTGMKTLSSLASTASPYGIIAMIIGVIAAVTGAGVLIARANKSTDDSELDQGGALAGTTARDLKNQADQNRQAIAAERDALLKQGPPKA